MKKIGLLLFTLVLLASCGSSKPHVVTTKQDYKEQKSRNSEKFSKTIDKKLHKVVKIAKTYEGTPYKFGGTTSNGMDCSGLIYTACLEEGISLPRTSKAMSQYGEKIRERDIDVGDLLFFETNKSSRKINHVGLVVDKKSGKIYFIHSTTSRGVIISSLDEDYWRESFVMVRRII